MMKRPRIVAMGAAVLLAAVAVSGTGASQAGSDPAAARRAVLADLGDKIGCQELRSAGTVLNGSLDHECLEPNGNWAFLRNLDSEQTMQLFLKNVASDRYHHEYVIGDTWALSGVTMLSTRRAAVAAGGQAATL